MHEDFLPYLRDPLTAEPLSLEVDQRRGALIETGWLTSSSARYPIRSGVPRFVEDQAYTGSFGYEWSRWPRLQFDSENEGRPMQGYTREMWERVTGCRGDLDGCLVADIGCGAGRFLEVVRRKGARVIGFDYSQAVDVARANFADDQKVLICQADALRLPLAPQSLDSIFSIGVLHHLPDPLRAFEQMTRAVKPGGWASVCVYEKSGFYNYPNVQMWRKFFSLLCPILGHKPALVYSYATVYGFRPIERISLLRKLVKIVFPYISLADPRWGVLDTFDSVTPEYQSGHTGEEVREWFERVGLESIENTDWGSTSFVGCVPSARAQAK